jgi:hypothetical protein
MLTLFYPPFRAADDVEMLELSVKGIRAYAEDLADHPEHVLRKAWREVRRVHKTERWPTINVILEACRSGSGSGGGSRGYRRANPDEEEYQRRAYGQVYMPMVQERDVEHHRRQARDKEAGLLKGPRELNPFSAIRSAA